ncbi:universal stress protein [Sagittula stellata]|uniref:UspA n=1 Tax=Sagittula stellata (strain ATCC 700073 / DSM 11524 / E-37) TaxID=388399 RepID=A3K111_SAGS3|nr:universal stress protein [Sagittula stellata]EBA09476.1 UspA [Sagittula stellata E-37]
MFRHIMIPVDLGHMEKLERALGVAAAEAKQHGCPVTYVSVTGNTPGPQGHSPEEFQSKLAKFAADQAAAHGIETDAHTIVAHDPSIDVDDKLLAAVDEIGADLVVMASHPPNMADYFWPSHGGSLASHASVSVMLVRDN